MSEAKRLRVWWHADRERGVRRDHPTFATAHRRILADDAWGKRHAVRAYARAGTADRRPVVLVVPRRVDGRRRLMAVDGHHTLLALIEMGYRGRVLAAVRGRLLRRRPHRLRALKRKARR